MKQETGNNNPQTVRKVSIQQPLDGHSFSLPELREPLGEGEVAEVEMLMPRTMLAPAAMCDPADPERARAWFAACGMPLRDDECLVASDPADGIVALIAARRDVVSLLRETWGGALRFTTPLLHEPPQRETCVWIHRTAGMTWVKVYDKELQFAEVLSSDDDTELLYLLERLGGQFPLRDYTLYLSGAGSRDARRLAAKRFKKAICE